ncbi:NADH dehydrogenase [ubiquinone] 1 alpha subcomplex subunit 13 [Schistocerca serialis cubense]|uniref:NADH dehydrogenase [ubiquinone] 1 alpha subcomplex subunit 13 n=1 Tax=Schistocerca serialis cubense TaxID=2023355 RepID=UPI00214E730F|nr:NADH dehydrogenase [ubiquinone] 1 alpha subcomplex subunit 13 [Schistocerca serialis cubense]
MSTAKVQDMPPPGGYQSIKFARIPAKTYFSGSTMILGYFGITAAGLYAYYLNYRLIRREEIEMRSGRLAVFPMLLAERDREYLKQLRRNRDEEASLMSKVEGWEVGTYYGEPVYKSLPKDTLVDPMYQEYYAHSSYGDAVRRYNLKNWS